MGRRTMGSQAIAAKSGAGTGAACLGAAIQLDSHLMSAAVPEE